MADVDSLTWTQDRHLIPTRMPLGRACGCMGGIAVGSAVAVVLCLGLGLSWWWGLAAWAAAFVLSAMIGRALKRQVLLERVEFTRSQVSLTGPSSCSVVDIDTVIEVNVMHTGETADSRSTTLQLRFGRSNRLIKTVSLTNRHDPALASRLAQLLGPGIRIQESTTNIVREP
ncbi:hypothetical protein ITP53_32300 [Nonomuraea sp. K274]|uniref:Uncharacterized protein n=1 Tax=Nonomuraea cypriaca TaxID=1187855 RepID=A0A931AHP1_9ACTN|nr:hypothetical protein [Nonomuraea cypriaca]MBF8190315.1 hypothetical protein [Nonomuraea cypriaca]